MRSPSTSSNVKSTVAMGVLNSGRQCGGCADRLVVVLLVYPSIYYIWKGWGLKESADAADSTG